MDIQNRLDQLSTVLADKQGVFYILISQLDPDAVGSAIGLQFLVQQINPDLQIKIFYCGNVGHPQNMCLLNRYNMLGTVLRHVDDHEFMPCAEGVYYSLVDSSTVKDNRLGKLKEAFIPCVVIDHHRSELELTDDMFLWIEELGSASTLLVELIRHYKESVKQDVQLPERLAAALAIGIYTDTKALVTGSMRDREAYGFISQFVPVDQLNALIEYPLPASHYDNFLYALSHMERHGSRLVASVGYVKPEEGDDLSTIADYLIRMDGTSMVVVWGIIGNAVRISARNIDLTTPLDRFLKECFGERSGAKLTPEGRGEGGALIELDLGFWLSESTKEEVRALVAKQISSLIFQAGPNE